MYFFNEVVLVIGIIPCYGAPVPGKIRRGTQTTRWKGKGAGHTVLTTPDDGSIPTVGDEEAIIPC